MLKFFLFITAACLALPAYAQQAPEPAREELPPAKDKAAPAENAPGAASSGGVVDPARYVIGPEDILFIRVWREPDLSGQILVRPDGRITLPLVKDVQASGLTPEQLAKSITEGLSKYMTEPEVSVAIQAVNSKVYYIQGEVLKPGKYPLLVPTTVLQALVNAGGFQEFANKKKIVIMRGDERLKFNYNDVIKGKKREQNIVLQNGDLIVVP